MPGFMLELVEFFDNAIFNVVIISKHYTLELVEFFDNAIFVGRFSDGLIVLELVEFFDNAIFQLYPEPMLLLAGACRVF